MDLKRFYGSKVGDKIILLDRECFHCVKVTRHKKGYSLICCTGDGLDYYSTIEDITNDTVVCSIDKTEANLSEPKSRIILCQALCKEFDFVVQKAVELGVTDIVPFMSERCNVKKYSLERTENIVLDAAKQCGRAVLPIIHPITDFDGILDSFENITNKIFCYELERKKSINSAVVNSKENSVIVIGSEGGFSEKEVELAKVKGFQITTLGRRILRVETASICAITLLLNAIGDLC